MTGMMDNNDRDKITAAFKQAAEHLLACDVWHGHWRIEIDGCIFKFRIEAYPKAVAEFEAEKRR